jgi:small-conductance mechanosensitive channel
MIYFDFLKTIPIEKITNYFFLIIFVVIGFLLGFILERFLFTPIRQKIKRGFGVRQIALLDGLKDMWLVWFSLVGLYTGSLYIGMSRVVQSGINKTIVVLLYTSFFFVLACIISSLIEQAAERQNHSVGASSLISNIIKLFGVLLGVTIGLQAIRVPVTPIVTALGVGGIAIALALQDTLSNLFSGIQLLLTKHIRIGDYIRTESGDEGTVRDITWRNTSIETFEKALLIIPNTILGKNRITNFSIPFEEVRARVPFVISREADLNKVENLFYKYACTYRDTSDVCVKDSDPIVRFQIVEEFFVRGVVNIKTINPDASFLVKHEVLRDLHTICQKEEIPLFLPRFKKE